MEFFSLATHNKIAYIKDVKVRPLKINRDESGILVETLRADWSDVVNDNQPFAMQYYSVTDSMVARDEDVWHFHPTVQDDRFLVVSGTIVAAVADTREDSETKDKLNLFHMDALKDPYLLLIPRQTLHGFIVVSKEPAILLNFPTALYNPKEEGRVPHAHAHIKTDTGENFSWDLVRKKLT